MSITKYLTPKPPIDIEFLASLIPLEGLNILDVGSGAGEALHFMSNLDASVQGIEPSETQISLAMESFPQIQEFLTHGSGAELPFGDNQFDLVTYFNSLHHIPVDQMEGAMFESKRVLKSTGKIYIAEPLCQGPCFDLYAPVDDETVVREAAIRTVKNLSDKLFREVGEHHYDTYYGYSCFEEFEYELVRYEPWRCRWLARNNDLLHSLFFTLGEKVGSQYRFVQPMRVNILEKVA